MQALMSSISKLDNKNMKVGRVSSLKDFLQEFWRDLTELLLKGGFLSVVTHFSRATLSSESARNPIVTYVKLEMSAVLYFNCTSISVHNNVTRKYCQNF